MPVIAVVEDSVDSRRALARVLRAGGFEPRVYSSAEEFLGAHEAAPDGLLLDLHLGGMSGLDLQQQLFDEGSTIPVVVVTAYDDGRSRQRAERLGCAAFLHKPCDATTILAAVRAAVSHEPSPG
jgi:FixJ family two-component response regulator